MWMRRPNAAHCAARRRGAGAAASRRRRLRHDAANALSVAGWRPLYETCRARAPTGAAGPAPRDRRASSTQLDSRWPRDLPQGVIHADLFPDNVFFLGDRLSGLIDFYFACTDMLAYDVAICLNAWCFEPDRSFNVTKGRALLAGLCSGAAAVARRGAARRCRCWRAARRCASC